MRRIAQPLLLALLAGEAIAAGQAAPGVEPARAVGDVLVDIGGRRLHLSCIGTGSPTVILEAGHGDSAAAWKAVQPAVAGLTRVCAYDRAGRGTSDPDPGTAPRTSLSVVDDLRRLLRAAPVAGPYVLVGHSLGGAHIRLYAARFPQDVVGMVLVDASHEDQFARFTATGYAGPLTQPPDQDPERLDAVRALQETGEEKWRADVPLIVLTHGLPVAPSFPKVTPDQAASIEAAWLEMQHELASGSPQGRLVIAQKSGHYVHYQEPELVIQSIREVVTAARTK